MSFTEWLTQRVAEKRLVLRMHTRLHDRLGESAASTVLYSHYKSPSGRDKVIEITYYAAPLGVGEFWLEKTKLQLEELEAHLAKLHLGWPEAWCVERESICTTETATGGSITPLTHPSQLIHLARMHGLILGEIKPYLTEDYGLKKAGQRLSALLRKQTNDWHNMVG